ncbi:MAG: MBL fold metallo-hydrolase [Myxococcales bacterium]|nr:MBL fold metallo-hydrolase [Myxococcales bacterium]
MIFALIGAALAGDLRVDVLDVGQGDSILIRTPANKVILIDAGESGGHVSEQLKREGVDHIDLVIATHPHADHIGGMQKVLHDYPVKLFVDNSLPHTTQTYEGVMAEIEARKIPYRAGVNGSVFNLDDGAKLEILFPNGAALTGTRSDLNANSVVTRLTHGSDCFLFTGDSEEPTERALLAQGLTQCNVLKVAHHGSLYSSTGAFLAVVKPTIALISAAAGNRYHHPDPATIERLRALGTAIYRTDESGQISLTSTGHGVTVRTAHPPVAVPSTAPPWYPPGTAPPANAQPLAPAAVATGPTVPIQTAGRVDLNSADQAALESLPGIGPSKASAILQYRTDHGRFKSVEELDNVSGIGPSTMSGIRDLVTTGQP